MTAAHQAFGTLQAPTTGSATVPWPTHLPGDIALLWVVSSAGGTTETLTTAAGFTLIETQTTGSGTAGTKHSVYWARATSAAMASPVVAAGSDFKYAIIQTIRGAVRTGSPVDAFLGGVKAAASTAATMPAVTTTAVHDLIVLGITKDSDSTAAFVTSMTNANLAGLVEVHDAGTQAGAGGGLSVYTGAKLTAGDTGTTAVVVTSSINSFTTIAVKSAPVENTFEGTNGATFTTTSTPADEQGPSALASGTQTYSTTKGSAQSGHTSALQVTNAANAPAGAYFAFSSPTTAQRRSFRFWVWIPSTFTGEDTRFYTDQTAANAQIANVHMLATGALIFRRADSTEAITSGATLLPKDQWVMIQGAVTVSNGTLELAFYAATDLTTPLWSGSATGQAIGSAAGGRVALGPIANNAQAATFWYDDLHATDTLASGFPPPRVSDTEIKTTTGSLPITVAPTGTAVEVGVSGGSLPITTGFTGTAVEVGVSGANLGVAVGLAGTATTIATATGTLAATGGLAASVVKVTTSTGSLPVTAGLTGALSYPSFEHVSASAYGVNGDGVADNQTALTDAIAAARAQGLPLYLPAGTYNHSARIYLDSAVLFGDGVDQTILKGTTVENFAVYMQGTNPGLHALTITATGSSPRTDTRPGNGIYVDAATGYVIRGVRVHDVAGAGIMAEFSSYGKVTHNLVENNGADGIYHTESCHHVEVAYNRTNNTGDDALSLTSYGSKYVHDVEIHHNAVVGNWQSRAITVNGVSGGVVIHHNHVDGGTAGLAFTSNDNWASTNITGVTAHNNTIRNINQTYQNTGNAIGGGAISFWNDNPGDDTGIEAFDNQIYNPGLYGIYAGGISDIIATVRDSSFYMDGNTLYYSDNANAVITRTNLTTASEASYPGDLIASDVGGLEDGYLYSPAAVNEMPVTVGLTGVATLVMTTTGSLSGAAGLTGTVTVTVTTTGTLGTVAGLTGSATKVGVSNGTLSAAATLTGSASTVTSTSGSLLVTAGLAATAATTAVTVGDLPVIAGLTGTTTEVGVSPADLPVTVGLTGTAVTVATAAGTLPATAGMVGSAIEVGVSSATLPITAGLAGSAVEIGVSPADLPVTVGLTGTAVTVVSTTGTLSADTGVAGTGGVVVSYTTTGTLPATVGVTGAVAAVATTTATLPADASFTGTGTTVAVSAGTLPADTELVGNVAEVGSTTGTLPVTVGYTSITATIITTTGILAVAVALIGAARNIEGYRDILIVDVTVTQRPLTATVARNPLTATTVGNQRTTTVTGNGLMVNVDANPLEVEATR